MVVIRSVNSSGLRAKIKCMVIISPVFLPLSDACSFMNKKDIYLILKKWRNNCTHLSSSGWQQLVWRHLLCPNSSAVFWSQASSYWPVFCSCTISINPSWESQTWSMLHLYASNTNYILLLLMSHQKVFFMLNSVVCSHSEIKVLYIWVPLLYVVSW